MIYRKDIDGLRCLAILPVVFYHLGFSYHLPGGFIGVDIFFVISGFLISTIIFNSISENNYSLSDFYYRRIKRIFPTLIVLYLFVIIVSLIRHLPVESEGVGWSLLSSLFFVSNYYFYFTSGYFDATSSSNYLLHTWSLSVEEQFYVLIPIFFLAMKKLNRTTMLIFFSILFLISLSYSVFLAFTDKDGAYYSVFSRAFELMLGTILALIRPSVSRVTFRMEVLAVLSIFVIVCSFFIVSKDSPFPGYVVLPACLATAYLIYSGRFGTLVSKVLSLNLFVKIGLISYSLYLWHWPIWVLFNDFTQFEGLIGHVYKLFIVIFCIIVSYLSWRFVENTFRYSEFSKNRSLVFKSYFVSSLFIVLLSSSLAVLNRSIWNTPEKAESIYNYVNTSKIQNLNNFNCFIESRSTTPFDFSNCLSLEMSKRNILVVGDSHAAHLVWGIQNTRSDLNVLQLTASGCKPFLHPKGESRCVNLLTGYLELDIINQIDVLVIAARWESRDLAQIDSLLLSLSDLNATVLLIGRVGEFNQNLPKLLARGIIKFDDVKKAEEYAYEYENVDVHKINSMIEMLTFPPNVTFVNSANILETFCNNLLYFDDTPRQFDYGHFTEKGSECFAKALTISSAL